MSIELLNDPSEQIAPESSKRFQWIKGEHIGVVEHLDYTYIESGASVYHFQSGREISDLKISGQMIELSDTQEPFTLSSIHNLSDSSNSTVSSMFETSAKSNLQTTPVPKKSPIQEILDKQKSNIINLNISFDLNFPKKEVYLLLKDSFDIDLDNEIINYTMSKIDNKFIKDQLEKTIIEQLQAYANNK